MRSVRSEEYDEIPTYKRLALRDGRRERAGGLLHRRVRVDAMGVEDVDIVETHPSK